MPGAFLIDLTRLASRFGGRTLTGIDRVELAWLRRISVRPEPVFGLIGLKGRQLLVDRTGLERLAGAFPDGIPPDPLAPVAWGLPRGPRARLGLRRMMAGAKLGETPSDRLPGLLDAHLPSSTVFVNAGHTNLCPQVLSAIRGRAGSRNVVLIHDAIPLDHPELQSPPAKGRFRRRLTAAAMHADCLAYSTEFARIRVESHLAGRIPEPVVAPFGPVLTPPAGSRPEAGQGFTFISTIEPRKNHAFLFDLWASLLSDPPPGGVPKLTVIGRRGWADETLFRRLEALKATGRVEELTGAPDSVVADVLGRSSALLFPSLVEGFGIPPLEAAAFGVPSVCAPLPPIREVLGDIPVYLETTDIYRWRETIIELMDETKQRAERKRIGSLVSKQALPTWDSHFNTILSAVG